MYDEIRFPSDNTLGIPALKKELQAEYLTKPTLCWGSTARNRENSGTWHFYTDDYRWNTLIKNPDKLIQTKPSICCELNITLFEDTPPALALPEIFKKRWVSRYLQEHGIKIIVDLYVPNELRDLNLLGVPPGWKSYSTRGISKQIEELNNDYETAVNHAGTDQVMFVVFCGGSKAADWCTEHNAIHVPYKAKKNVHSIQNLL